MLASAGAKEQSAPMASTCAAVCCCCCCSVVVAIVVVGLYVANCIFATMGQESIVLPLAKDLQGGHIFTLRNMSNIPQGAWKELKTELNNSWTTETGYSFGYADATKAGQLLYQGSKVSEIFEEIPTAFRGVYWMKDNPLPEVLAVIQYGKWYPKEKSLLVPNSPWIWAWYGGERSDPPSSASPIARLTYNFVSGKQLAESYVEPSSLDTLVSFRFEDCPEGAECVEGSSNLTYAELMSHPNGDLSKHGMVYYDGYTMEEYPRTGQPGSLYFRRASLLCGLLGGGSGYNLTKVIDAHGKPLEPHYSDYLKFMSGRPLIIWSGLPQSQA